MSSGDEYDDELTMLEDISDGSKYHPSINMTEARYNIRDFIKRGQVEQKRALLSMRNMGKGLHNLFKTSVVNYISQALPILNESGSEVSYFTAEPRNFAEITRLSEDIRKS